MHFRCANICCLVIGTLHVCCCRTLHCGRTWETAIQRYDGWLMTFAMLHGSLITEPTGLSTWLASLSSTSSYSEILQSTITLSAGDKDQIPMKGIQHHGTSLWDVLNTLAFRNCLQLRKVLQLSPLSRHIWKPKCFLLHTTRSNISSATGVTDSNSSTNGTTYKCFWHLTSFYWYTDWTVSSLQCHHLPCTCIMVLSQHIGHCRFHSY